VDASDHASLSYFLFYEGVMGLSVDKRSIMGSIGVVAPICFFCDKNGKKWTYS
jgi:hypothetical protein